MVMKEKLTGRLAIVKLIVKQYRGAPPRNCRVRIFGFQ